MTRGEGEMGRGLSRKEVRVRREGGEEGGGKEGRG